MTNFTTFYSYRDEFGYAPLDEASVDQNNSELVKLLIDARAEVNPMDVEVNLTNTSFQGVYSYMLVYKINRKLHSKEPATSVAVIQFLCYLNMEQKLIQMLLKRL